MVARGVGARRRARDDRVSPDVAERGGVGIFIAALAARGTDMAVAVGPGRNDQYRPPKQQAKDADQHVGRRIREWRMMLGVSQRTLAGQIGVTSQQLRKYERGTHRISAASLYRVARSLGVGVDCFFEG